MAVRLKTRWHKSRRSERNRRGSNAPKQLKDLASVIGINIWKMAKEVFLHMEKQGYRFGEDQQSVNVLSEFVIYQVHIVDRLLYGVVDDSERNEFVNVTANYLMETVVENQIDLMGPGEYEQLFLQRMNSRFDEYSECSFENEQPGYALTRTLAMHVAEEMKVTDDKWVIEQVIDIEAPSIIEKIVAVANEVLGLRQRKNSGSENRKE